MRINRFIRWFIDNFFVVLLTAYSLLCAYWYIISDDSPIGLLIFSAVFYILWKIFSKYNILRHIFRTITILFLVLNGVYLLSFLPELEQVASYNGYIYFLTYNREFLGNGISFPHLAKWNNKFHHSVSGLGETCCTLRLTYDPLTHLVSVVQIGLEDTPTLAYTDSNPPRLYVLGENTQIDKYRYYPSWDCESNQNNICQTHTYNVYRCSLENTGCVQLPFQYSGDYAFDIEITQNKQNEEINIYFWIGDYPGVQTLIFTYGNNSSCHLAGCQLLTQKGKISP